MTIDQLAALDAAYRRHLTEHSLAETRRGLALRQEQHAYISPRWAESIAQLERKLGEMR